MKQLVRRGAIRRLRRGRGFRYDLGPVYEMLKNPAAALLAAAKKPSQGFTSEGDDGVDSTTLMLENATGSDGESDTNYISVSDQTNHIDATPKDRFCRTDSDHANERTRGIDAGSEFEHEARLAAVRLGLRTYCPHDEEWARDDIHEAILLVNGEPLNRGALDRLIERHGIIACWSQAKYLAERIDRFPTKVEKPTALYVRAVETGAGRQGGQSREERDRRIEQIVADLRTDKMRFDDIPPELDDQVMQRYAAAVLSEPPDFDSGQQPEECDDTEIPF